jgi:hypothetical protein
MCLKSSIKLKIKYFFFRNTPQDTYRGVLEEKIPKSELNKIKLIINSPIVKHNLLR